MNSLYLGNHKIESVFQLLGNSENDISFSVAWVLSRCPSFLREFLDQTIGFVEDVSDVEIRLQSYEVNRGFTDIEIELPGYFFVIIEAKKGWNLPKREQLEKYAGRNDFEKNEVPLKKILILSECSKEYAEAKLKLSKVADVPISSISWTEAAEWAKKARPLADNAGKRLIEELLTYLGDVTTVQDINSNEVYVVALNDGAPEGWNISWINIVEEEGKYFHPVAKKNWPKTPPNYIAFRYDGKLQSIHHIEGYEVVTNFHESITGAPDQEKESHFLYTLGPAFGPDKEVKTGSKIRQARHARCMLDTLFTCETISEAEEASRKRREKV